MGAEKATLIPQFLFLQNCFFNREFVVESGESCPKPSVVITFQIQQESFCFDTAAVSA